MFRAVPLQAESDITYPVVVAHFAAFSDKLPRSRVDVSIDGEQAVNGLAYLQQAKNISLDGGTHEIGVAPLEWSGGAFTQSVDVPSSEVIGLTEPGVVLAIHGGTSGVRLGVTAQLIELAPPADGAKVRLTNLALYTVDGESEYTLCKEDGSKFIHMTMVSYGESSKYSEMPAGEYRAYLAGSHGGCQERLTPDHVIILEDSSVADLYAVGTNASGEFPNTLTVVSTSAVVLRPTAYVPFVAN